MRGKLLFITGGVVGYVLGARAGRKRYDQIASVASDLWNAPPVQRRVTVVRDFTLDAIGDLPTALYGASKKAFKAAQNKKEASTADSDTSSVTTTAAAAATMAPKSEPAKSEPAKPAAKKAAATKPASKGPAATSPSADSAEPKSPNER